MHVLELFLYQKLTYLAFVASETFSGGPKAKAKATSPCMANSGVCLRNNFKSGLHVNCAHVDYC